MDKIQVKFILFNRNIKFWKMIQYQNRDIIRISKVPSVMYRSIVEEFNEYNLTKKKLYVKMDLNFFEKVWLFITGRRYSIKDYRGVKK